MRHFDLRSFCLRVNGRQVPSEALEPDFTHEPPLTAREYTWLFMNTGSYRLDRGNCITQPAFHSGCSIFPIDLNYDLCNGAHLHRAQEGTITAEIHWKTALTRPITILVHCSYDEVIVNQPTMNSFQEFEI